MKLSVSTWSAHEQLLSGALSKLDFVKLLNKHGITGMEVVEFDFADSSFESMKELFELGKEYGVDITCMSLEHDLCQYTEEDRQAVQELAVKCEQVGTEIDVMTGRKNNSKNISEMVYKIALEMGISQNTVMIYFCASMVYDIGFLSMDKDLLQAETLTDEQKYIIRSHVKIDVSVFDFVPEHYRAVFIDAASMHHENMDGSGYPDGIPGDKIPEIARMIHVVETFISLISRRSYRAIFDKESAIEELKNHPELYDQKIVSVLDCII